MCPFRFGGEIRGAGCFFSGFFAFLLQTFTSSSRRRYFRSDAVSLSYYLVSFFSLGPIRKPVSSPLSSCPFPQ